MFVSAPRIDAALGGRQVGNARFILEGGLRAVAVMCVEINDQHALYPLGKGILNSNGKVVEQAEAHGTARLRVMPWRAGARKGRGPRARENCAGTLDRGTGCFNRRLKGAGSNVGGCGIVDGVAPARP